MKKKILILVSILTITLTAYATAVPDLPALPPADEIVNPSPANEKSFWDKVLDFFGLGEKEKLEEATKTTEVVPSLPVAPNNIEAGAAPIDTNKPIETASSNQAPSVMKLPDMPQTASEPAPTVPVTPITTAPDDKKSLGLPETAPEKNDAILKQTPTPDSTPVNEPLKQDIQASADSLKLPEGFADEADSNNIKQVELKPDQPKEPTLALAPALSDKGANNIPVQAEPTPQLALADASLEPAANIEAKPSLPTLNKEAEKLMEQPDASSKVSKYRKQLQERLNQAQDLPQIPKEEVNKNTALVNTDTDSKQLKFINDEVQVLTMPNDDLVLGELTEEARLNLIDFSTYATLFWENYNIVKNEPARTAIDNFIKDYDSEDQKYSKQEIAEALTEAFAAIDYNSIYQLINLLENYPILQLTDQDGNNLLHKAVSVENYSAAKFVLMKGINLSAINNCGQRAIDIAISKDNQSIITLLEAAGAK